MYKSRTLWKEGTAYSEKCWSGAQTVLKDIPPGLSNSDFAIGWYCDISCHTAQINDKRSNGKKYHERILRKSRWKYRVQPLGNGNHRKWVWGSDVCACVRRIARPRTLPSSTRPGSARSATRRRFALSDSAAATAVSAFRAAFLAPQNQGRSK